MLQDKLSKIVNITLHKITKIELGATPDRKIEIIKKITKNLNVGTDDLFKL